MRRIGDELPLCPGGRAEHLEQQVESVHQGPDFRRDRTDIKRTQLARRPRLDLPPDGDDGLEGQGARDPDDQQGHVDLYEIYEPGARQNEMTRRAARVGGFGDGYSCQSYR